MKLNAKYIAEKAQQQRSQRCQHCQTKAKKKRHTNSCPDGDAGSGDCTMNALGHWPVPARSQCRSDAIPYKLEELELQLEEVLNLFESCNSPSKRGEGEGWRERERQGQAPAPSIFANLFRRLNLKIMINMFVGN